MVQSVELVLAPDAESRVLGVWRDLLEAGLPSQARHTAPSNRPHVTLVAVPRLSNAAEAALPSIVTDRLTWQADWGDLHTFGRGSSVLVQLVTAGPELRALQAKIARVCDVPADSLSAPEQWTPHVTLARRVGEAELPPALRVAQASLARDVAPGIPLSFAAVRRWDGEAKREWTIA